MSLIGIILFIAFFILLAKAIFETIYGIFLIIHGLFWHSIAFVLSSFASIIRIYKRILFKQKRCNKRKENSLGVILAGM